MRTSLSTRPVETPEEALLMAVRLAFGRSVDPTELLPHQEPPDPSGEWEVWLIYGGRGSGKTFAGSDYVIEHLREQGDRARVGVGAPTIGDARDTCLEGVSGLITKYPDEFDYNRSLLEATHKYGGKVKALGSEKPDRWNGPSFSLIWADELALWNKKSWEQAQFALRLGEKPRAVATTTPKARRFVRDLADEETTHVSHATTFDNPHLPGFTVRRLRRMYDGTRLGRQELYAEFLRDVEGALWQYALIDDNRVGLEEVPGIERVVVSVDPATTSTDRSDRTGITVAGYGTDGDYYVFGIGEYVFSPRRWAIEACDRYDEWEADRIIAEVNNGGDMVESTIRNVRPEVPVKQIRASRGKTVRAEPVAALYEQGRVHHVGLFPEAEEQMCAFPIENEYDDATDSLVYALTELAEGMSADWAGVKTKESGLEGRGGDW